MNQSIFIRASAGLGSLAGYYIARSNGTQSWYPYVVLGGLLGAIVGDMILSQTSHQHDHLDDPGHHHHLNHNDQ
ncbi:MAG: hypothetical protein AAF998_18425 [Bacteroidota bacterium]